MTQFLGTLLVFPTLYKDYMEFVEFQLIFQTKMKFQPVFWLIGFYQSKGVSIYLGSSYLRYSESCLYLSLYQRQCLRFMVTSTKFQLKCHIHLSGLRLKLLGATRGWQIISVVLSLLLGARSTWENYIVLLRIWSLKSCLSQT